MPRIAAILAAVVVAVALRGLFGRVWTRRLAVVSLVVDASVAIAFVWLYAYDPRNYAFALIPAVCVEAVVTFGLGTGVVVWGLGSAAYVLKELFSLRLSNHPAYPPVELLRVSLALLAVIVTEALLEGAALEREREGPT